ncbi:MAG: polysaccharide deacetylase family protein [Treponema sp.]|jgi:peptidoglycan/xylan/chitin deacetylase (PgdA/CDA1 family)|nr:polysaccharide deacetylase family protein [Treponema sp.]
MKKIRALVLLSLITVFFGCAGAAGTRENKGDIMVYAYTKAQIEQEIDNNWRAMGYSSRPDKFIAISFDDGPCGPSASGGTQAMLDKLDELKIKATFFLIGQNIRANKAEARSIFNAGHELGNHSNSYSSLGKADKEDIEESLDSASLLIKEITGKNPPLFRAPNLNHGIELTQVCMERGMSLIDGSVHGDWDGTGHTPQSITESVLSNPRDGQIIILHENNTSKGNTMEALAGITAGLREKGFWILSVGQLAAVKGETLEAGTRYSSI